ncbi:hypothetical protein [Arthrobacter sp. NEB 688]|uniref:hypothetical protein n=1 Tax=Arthrobacter sp. NEB 688 TaxID=904039 RepID=UPI0015669419|nr:hypothetical protein [Arthrobacter sp. NEB 688]QKE82999.1 hypothetical protein HL663_02870 [Arthrobacter sp. NEB 688]
MVVTVLALPLALVAFVVALARRQVITVGVNEHADVARIAARTRGWRLVGLALGLVAGGLLLALGQRVDALGRLTALAPAAVGAGVLLGTVVGELTSRPSVGVRRSAVVETRTVRSVLPRGRALLLAASGLALGGVLGAGAAWGSPDDLGRAGRSLSERCTVLVDGVATEMAGSRGPWPGSFYAVPLAAAFALLAVLTALALRAVVRRPRPDPHGLGLDSMLRRWSAGTVLTAALFAVLGTLGPVAALMVSPLAGLDCGPSPAQAVGRWVVTVLAPVALVGAAAALGALLVTPRIRVDDLPRPLPGDAAPVGTPVR